jgi:excisionase family DNA binding protein
MENIHKKLTELECKIQEQILLTKEFIDLNEASKYLKLSKSTLYKLTSKGEITYYRPGGKKIYFYKTDLHNWIRKGKILSIDNREEEIDSYLIGISKNNQS